MPRFCLSRLRAYSSVLSGNLWLLGKMKSNIGCMVGRVVPRVVPRFCLSRTVILLRVTLT